MESMSNGLHKVNMLDRKSITLSGINDVLSFDEAEVLLDSNQGMLSIKGEQLHVNRLSLEKGEVDVDGRIDSVVYRGEHSEKSKKGSNMLARLFR